MYRLDRFKVGGFRRLHEVDLEVRPLMVVIGANGVGKTSLHDACALLSASASGRLAQSISRQGGITSLLTRGRSDTLSFTVGMHVPDHEPLEYALHVQARDSGYAIVEESLSQRHAGFPEPFRHIDSSEGDIRYFEVEERRLIRPDWPHNPQETSLAQVPKMFRQPEELRRILATSTQYHVLDVGPRAPVKLPQAMRPATLPGTDGEDLVPYLYALREGERDRYDVIIDTLRAAFPDFEELNFPPVAAGMLTMTWKDAKFSKPIFMHELSEGTLRFIWLVALLQSPTLSTVTMIDEPEVSLHPEMLSLLADLMREASTRTQLIVTTHSDRLIRFLRPDEVLVMDIDDSGACTTTWADTFDLDAWLQEYTLDEIWRMGRIGGRA